MPNASVAIQVLPTVPGGEFIPAVDAVIAHLKASGLKAEVGPFETVLEGDYETLLKLVADASKIAAEAGADSVMTYVKIAYNPKGDVLTIADKVEKHRQ